jgi:hypothetical protein
MWAAGGLFNLDWRNGVAQDVTHVGSVPIEAFKIVQHK